MSEINLANWEIVDDAANNRIVIRSKSTGEEIELNESGTFSSTGSIDIDSLAFNTVEIAGSTVKLGASLTLDHTDLTNVNSGQHHARYSDEEAQDAVGTILSSSGSASVSYDDSNNTITIGATKYTDTEAVSAAESNTLTSVSFDGDQAIDASSGNRIRLPQVNGNPSNTSTGDIWYDTSSD